MAIKFTSAADAAAVRVAALQAREAVLTLANELVSFGHGGTPDEEAWAKHNQLLAVSRAISVILQAAIAYQDERPAGGES